MSPPGRDENKLPKWAQDELQRWRDRAEHWRKMYADLAASHAPSDVRIVNGLDEYHLEPGSRIKFYTRGVDDSQRARGGAITVWVDDEHGLYINGCDRIRVEPKASNVVRIATEE